MTGPRCRGVREDGAPCGAPRMRESEYCFWHAPEHAEEAAEARRLGGLRRRKERTVEGAYDLDGLDDVQLARRWIKIAAVDTLAQENSIARSRTLAYLATVTLRAHEQTELEERLRAVEEAMKPRASQRTGRRR